MEIIAATKGGYLVQATEAEVKEIFSAISNQITDKNPIKIGDKIPAFDYAMTIRTLRAIKDSYDFKEMKRRSGIFTEEVNKYVEIIESLSFDK